MGICTFFWGVESVAKVVRRRRLRWFGHVEHNSGMIGCRPVQMWWWQE